MRSWNPKLLSKCLSSENEMLASDLPASKRDSKSLYFPKIILVQLSLFFMEVSGNDKVVAQLDSSKSEGICNPARNVLFHVECHDFAQNVSGRVANPAVLR